MSCLVVLCPNGHRQKVSTNPNMSLQQVFETACTKKGFDPARHKLQHHNKSIDLSNSIRFSGIPNNSTLEMVELDETELSAVKDAKVTVCLQVEGGERLISEFAPACNLMDVITAFPGKLGQQNEGEEMVVVYMRNEVVGNQKLSTTSLKTLGLTSGKGLFRFFYKKPEVLKEQAKVYDMKVAPKTVEGKPEHRHLPMRLEAATLPPTSSLQPSTYSVEKPPGEQTEVKPTTKTDHKPLDPLTGGPIEETVTPATAPGDAFNAEVAPAPDSTSTAAVLQDVIEPITNPVGPNAAIIFSGEDAAINNKLPDVDDDDEFFQLSIEEVKNLYKELKLQVKEINDGGMLMTQEMRESQKEGEKLALLGRYKHCVLRVQFPDRNIVQGIFGPSTTVDDVMVWLKPLLQEETTPFELYTAPPRTVLQSSSTLLDLNLFPAALVHFSSLVTRADPVYLKPQFTQSLSNIQGANEAASQYRKGKQRPKTGLTGEYKVSEPLASIPESSCKRSGEPLTTQQPSGSASKMPKWFKPSKK